MNFSVTGTKKIEAVNHFLGGKLLSLSRDTIFLYWDKCYKAQRGAFVLNGKTIRNGSKFIQKQNNKICKLYSCFSWKFEIPFRSHTISWNRYAWNYFQSFQLQNLHPLWKIHWPWEWDPHLLPRYRHSGFLSQVSPLASRRRISLPVLIKQTE